jgi:hypothetical protein
VQRFVVFAVAAERMCSSFIVSQEYAVLQKIQFWSLCVLEVLVEIGALVVICCLS